MDRIPPEIADQLRKSGWLEGDKIGEGGGGTVFSCFGETLLKDLTTFAKEAGTIQSPERIELLSKKTVASLYSAMVVGRDGLAAVKIPHKVNDDKILERLTAEIEAMGACKHPALIRLFDHDKTKPPRWFVMEYHPLGSLGGDKHLTVYKGRILDALMALRPVIDGVSLLHRHNPSYVHRDIKPNNIFVSTTGSLILGDFGIIFTKPDDRTRLTRPGDVIISRDWIPDWIRHRDIADFNPKVDVHMLAKVLYFMLSGGKNVPSSQFDDPYFKLKENLPSVDQKELELVESLLRECITNSAAEQKLEDAGQLLERINILISELTYKRPYHLVFNAYFTDKNSYISIPLASTNQTILSGQLFLPDPCQQLIARFRVGTLTSNTKVILELKIEDGPSGRTEAVGQGLGLAGDIWTEPLILTSKKLLREGWYAFEVKAASPSKAGFYVSAFSIYAR